MIRSKESINSLHKVLSEFKIPNENLRITSDVAACSVALGWEKEGGDTDKGRPAKVKHDLPLPIILLREEITHRRAFQMINNTFVLTESEKEALNPEKNNGELFLAFLILHEIAHWDLKHHLKGIDEYEDVENIDDLTFRKEIEANYWAANQMRRLKNL